ncbi:MAG: KEOPS complex N(6)-L-threonylcarbamoyladenine synthase Kae1 [archaeon]
MLCLGIESTAHTFGVGVIENKKILANEKDVIKLEPSKGIDPKEAAKHHEEVKEKVLERALQKSRKELEDFDVVAYSAGPGLPPCLLVGYSFAKLICEKIGAKLVPVNHCIAHIEIGRFLCKFKDPLVVYVSGGNTQILGYEDGKYRIFGETLDIGLGNALDKFGREIGLSGIAGPDIENLAKKGKKYIELPYSVKGMDIVYSGIVTAAIKKSKDFPLEDLCYSFQETVFSMLVEVSERALAHTKKKSVLLVGGVASNKRLREMLQEMCLEHKAKFGVLPPEYNGDNGAMIALVGKLSHKNPENMKINPSWRTDQVEIFWRKKFCS